MKKVTLMEKLIRRTYGITGPLDEYRLREVERLGNRAFIFLYYSLIPSLAIAFFAGYHWPEFVALAFPFFIMVLLLGVGLYLSIQMQKSNIDAIDEEELTEKEKKQMKHGGIKLGLLFTFLMYIYNVFGSVWLEELPFGWHLFLSPRALASGLFSGFFYGIFMHIFIQSRKVHQDKTPSQYLPLMGGLASGLGLYLFRILILYLNQPNQNLLDIALSFKAYIFFVLGFVMTAGLVYLFTKFRQSQTDLDDF